MNIPNDNLSCLNIEDILIFSVKIRQTGQELNITIKSEVRKNSTVVFTIDWPFEYIWVCESIPRIVNPLNVSWNNPLLFMHKFMHKFHKGSYPDINSL